MESAGGLRLLNEPFGSATCAEIPLPPPPPGTCFNFHSGREGGGGLPPTPSPPLAPLPEDPSLPGSVALKPEESNPTQPNPTPPPLPWTPAPPPRPAQASPSPSPPRWDALPLLTLDGGQGLAHGTPCVHGLPLQRTRTSRRARRWCMWPCSLTKWPLRAARRTRGCRPGGRQVCVRGHVPGQCRVSGLCHTPTRKARGRTPHGSAPGLDLGEYTGRGGGGGRSRQYVEQQTSAQQKCAKLCRGI